MIKNEQEYQVTKEQIALLEAALADWAERTRKDSTLHPRLAKLEGDSIRSQLADMQSEIAEYETRKRKSRPAVVRSSKAVNRQPQRNE